MEWFWIIVVVLFLGTQFVSILLSLIQSVQTRRLIEIQDTKNFYSWMHGQPGFRSLNRVRSNDPDSDRALMYSWTIAYVKDGKHHETEKAFSPKMAIRMFKEAIE